jgi:hypothetical protein
MSKETLLHEFEKSLGIQLPRGLKQLLIKPKELEYCAIPAIDEFLLLADYGPRMPARCIPMFQEPNGNAVVLYYPRSSSAAMVCYFSQAEPVLIPQTCDLEGYFKDPDIYSPDHPDNDDEVKQDPPDFWKSLRYGSRAPLSEIELLKPFCFNSTQYGESDLEKLQALVSRFKPDSKKPVSQAQTTIRDKYEDPLSLLDRQWWLELAEQFSQQELWPEAIAALENCEWVHDVHPFYGYSKLVGGKPDWDSIYWGTIYEVVAKLYSVAAVHGDCLNRKTIGRKLELITAHAHDEGSIEFDGSGRSNEREAQPFVVTMDVNLKRIHEMSDIELSEVRATSNTGKEIASLPIQETSSAFMISIGRSVRVDFDFDFPEVQIGQLLKMISDFLEDEYLNNSPKYQTRGKQLVDINVTRLIWLPGDDSWEVVT